MAPCSLNGSTNFYHALYTCNLTLSNGNQAQAVWYTDGNETYTAPSQFTQYRDLAGDTNSVPSNHEVTIGLKPILLEETVTVKPVKPVLTSLTPSSKNAGGAAFTLTINGSDFIDGAVVLWNGIGRIKTFVNSTEMKAAIRVSDIAEAGTATVNVINPAPGESSVYSGCNCKISNTLIFTINP
jgi:hypothetical protein